MTGVVLVGILVLAMVALGPGRDAIEHHSARVIASSLVVVGVLCVLRLAGVIGAYVSNTSVNTDERTAISAYYIAHTNFYDHHTYVGCPLDVLGAHGAGSRTTVYGTVHCWTGDATCEDDSDWTDGVVAHLIDGKVVSEQYDASDMPDPQALKIYPRRLRGEANDLMDSGGPRGADRVAIELAGCQGREHPVYPKTG